MILRIQCLAEDAEILQENCQKLPRESVECREFNESKQKDDDSSKETM